MGNKGSRKPDREKRPDPRAVVSALLASLESARDQRRARDAGPIPCPLPGLFHTPDGVGWVRMVVREHVECHPVRSNRVRMLISHNYYARYGVVPPEATVSKAIRHLEVLAQMESPEEPTYLRVAGDRERIIIDLGDSEWRSLVVTAEGHMLLDYHPVAFRRSSTTRALPEPRFGGPIRPAEIHPALADQMTWALVSAWLVGSLRPWGAYTILSLVGESGSGKSGLACRLVSLVDPSEIVLRPPPRDELDLAAACKHSHALVFDNVSKISARLSDGLCRVSTGIAFAKRRFFTDSDEHHVVARRPIALTSIPDVVEASDLRDRTLVGRMERLSADQRKEDQRLAEEWTDTRPAVFGALLRALSTGLRRLPEIRLAEGTRMLDALTWAAACTPALGLSEDAMVRAHLAACDESASEAVEHSAVGQGLLALLERSALWEGTATALHGELERLVPPRARGREWPRDAQAVSYALRRLAPDLRRLGIEVERRKDRTRQRARIISLRRAAQPSEPSGASAPAGRTRAAEDGSDGSGG